MYCYKFSQLLYTLIFLNDASNPYQFSRRKLDKNINFGKIFDRYMAKMHHMFPFFYRKYDSIPNTCRGIRTHTGDKQLYIDFLYVLYMYTSITRNVRQL